MGKKWPPPVHLKEVVYMLSPFELKVMSGLWKNFWPSLKSSLREHRSDLLVFITPIVGTVAYARRYEMNRLIPRLPIRPSGPSYLKVGARLQERDKLEDRY
ncbi:hypothetical protein KFL_001860110 [Klebsormidium nitens]|uniref:Uncharacterized protein n=1 Tax=Klebsormidium nitens TaxID=105231 RepID=A0A1Y1I0C5_KLENI|nr:hypothetical protein KFL_001860110 [Klebsormidium nitens]|eukprot:GAQ84364.1 hypothetical protein KFL_001860110 [Klebsormidium nitens]